MNTRRQFMQAGAAAAAGALTPWPAMRALAATTGGTGYRAMVCLFMFGGNDSNNMLVPTDATRYTQYQHARPNLALSREQLLPIAIAGDYGLHPAMSGMQQLVNAGKAAVVANVGPLMVPTSKAQWSARSVPLPINLFSHSDQQGAWQSALVDAPARNGWGGRLLERALASGVANRGYSAISVAGGNLWEAGDLSLTPYRVSSSGRFGFDFYDAAGKDPLSLAITDLLAEQRSDPLQQTWLNVMGRSIDNQRVLTSALSASSLKTAFHFGRTLASNGKGSDHGWGSHHFVVGGAVRGGRVVGRFPTLVIDGPDDSGQGVWIPNVSTDQMSGDLAAWFGADATAIAEVFPRLRYFNRDLALMG